jgi:DNA-nicking Smr family endonuclease
MGNLVELARPLLFSFLTNCHTKKLVCDLIDRYVATTDNDIDDVIAKAVRIALLKGC